MAERTPSFMYPQGTSSSKMVLRGMDLLLDCIASGVYVPSAPSSSPAAGGGVGISPHICRHTSMQGEGSKRPREQNTACLSSAPHYDRPCFGEREKARTGHTDHMEY